jgi:hypothetical protein
MTLACLRWTACLTDSDRTSTIPLTWAGKEKSKYDPNVFMASREVRFTDTSHSTVRIELR